MAKGAIVKRNIRTRSTSPLMERLFKDDLDITIPRYDKLMDAQIEKYPFLEDVFNDCKRRTGFLLPYMCTEYGHYAMTGKFMDSQTSNATISFALIGLCVAIDDDIVDELSGDKLRAIKNASASELLQNLAYSRLLECPAARFNAIVSRTIQEYLATVTKYQCKDMANISEFYKGRFDEGAYLDATFKTGSYFAHGLRLGVSLAGGGDKFLETAWNLGKYLGVALQLIDDQLDKDDDFKTYGKKAITLPMYVDLHMVELSYITSIIQENLTKAKQCAELYPYSKKLFGLVSTFDELKDELF